MKKELAVGSRVQILSLERISKAACDRFRGKIGIVIEQWNDEFILESEGRLMDYSFFRDELLVL